jgi:hypothetical protein
VLVVAGTADMWQRFLTAVAVRRGRTMAYWHMAQGHLVKGTVVRDARGKGPFEFYFRKGARCFDCGKEWLR